MYQSYPKLIRQLPGFKKAFIESFMLPASGYSVFVIAGVFYLVTTQFNDQQGFYFQDPL
jgi:hypothetical protein